MIELDWAEIVVALPQLWEENVAETRVKHVCREKERKKHHEEEVVGHCKLDDLYFHLKKSRAIVVLGCDDHANDQNETHENAQRH